jgi:hypothetical protein
MEEPGRVGESLFLTEFFRQDNKIIGKNFDRRNMKDMKNRTAKKEAFSFM